MPHHVGEHVEVAVHVLGEAVDPIHGAVERGVGVHLSALSLDGLRYLLRRALVRAFEKHVLDEMREARAGPFLLADAAGLDPNNPKRLFNE